MTISHPRALALGLSLVLASCGGEGLILPPDGAAAHIEILEGNAQSARVQTTLADSLVVRVTDTQARPVAGANVVFDFTADGSAASPATVNTDADGRAASRLAVGTRVGPVTGTVSVPVNPGVTPVQATITATALADNANGIALVSGNDQTAQVGTALPLPLVVVVTDAFGNPISGVAVEWTVTGGGSVSNPSTVTNANGQASVTRTLGSVAGPQTAVATAAGLAGSPVTFTHSATAGSAAGVTKVSGDNQSGSPGQQLALPLVVQVLDGSGNPIANRAVTWVIGQGDGSVAPANTTTDAQGNASTQWTLGPGVGANTVNAVVSGVGTATFSATATAGTPSASNTAVSASPNNITVGSGSSTITVTVRDASDNPVAGAAVSVSSSGTGNNISPASASSGANGVATFTFSSSVAETKTITATAGGVEVNQKPTIVVQKAASTTRITSDEPDPSTAGVAVRVEFTVSGSGGTPTGDVNVTLSGGSESCTGTVAQGFCEITPLAAGNPRTITATYVGDAQFNGSNDTERHKVDPAAAASTTTTITTDNPDPSQVGDAVTVTFTVTSLAGTPTGDVTVTDPVAGTVSCTASVAAGSCSYTPGGSGPRTITATYTPSSSAFNGSSDTEQHDVNTPPTANDDGTLGEFMALSGQEFSVPGPGVLANDSPPEAGDNYVTTLSAQASNGTATVGPNGDFKYTSNPLFTGQDSFQYKLSDGRGGTDVATVFIQVN